MTEPMTAEQIAACRAVLEVLDPMPSDPWSEEIRERALRRARRERSTVPSPVPRTAPTGEESGS